MMLPAAKLLVAIITAAAALAQDSAASGPEFEVASIKPSAPDSANRMSFGVHIDGALIAIHSYSLKDCIMLAYDVREFQVSGPDWLDAQKFEITAKLPQGAPRKQLLQMMRSLLADRFKLAVDVQKKEFPVYALIVSKNGPKLKESAAAAEADATGEDKNNVKVNVDVNTGSPGGGRGSSVVDLGNGAFISSANGRIEAHKVTMSQLTETLWRYVDRPVVDMTALAGAYDLSLPYGVDELRNLLRVSHSDRHIPDDALPPASLFDSLKAVGLTLDPRKAPLDFVVVEHAERMPAAN